jgi:lipopolysaccharide export system permease protein
MDRLDRYVGRIVAGSWISCLVFLVLLSVLIDLLNSLPVYLDQADKLGTFGLMLQLASYYLQMVPSFFVSVAPFVTVIACMFAATRLMASQELHPMLFAGRSMVRVLRPMLLCGAASAAAMAACWEWGLPSLGDSFTQSRDVLRPGQEKQKLATIVLLLDSGRLFVQAYDKAERTMTGVALRLDHPSGESELVLADSAVWDPHMGDWHLEHGRVGSGADYREVPREWLQEPGLSPERVVRDGREQIDMDFLSYGELFELAQRRPLRADVKLTLQRRISYPLANLLLVLLAMPVTIHFERKSRVERVLGAILFCGAYLITDLTCQSLGLRGFVNPIVAAWSPTILFGSLGLVMFGSLKT